MPAKTAPPSTLSEMNKTRKGLEIFLRSRGSVVRDVTSDWEVIRFTTPDGMGIVWRNASRDLKWNVAALAAFHAYRTGSPEWRLVEPVPRIQSKSRKRGLIQQLRERDGDDCFYCGWPLGEDVTLEHFVPVSLGGPNHAVNCALAHFQCNQDADNLPVVDKVRLRGKNLGQCESREPDEQGVRHDAVKGPSLDRQP